MPSTPPGHPARSRRPRNQRTGTPRTAPPAGPTTGSADFYTAAEAAYLISLSVGATVDLIRTGRMPGRRRGGQWLVPRPALHAWIEALPDASPDEDLDDGFNDGQDG